jgi:hypothetical protein
MWVQNKIIESVGTEADFELYSTVDEQLVIFFLDFLDIFFCPRTENRRASWRYKDLFWLRCSPRQRRVQPRDLNFNLSHSPTSRLAPSLSFISLNEAYETRDMI